ncbi:hypothetical protein V8E54_014008 [Elaphomyces granulatus]
MKILLFLFATLLASLVSGRVINDNLIVSSMTCDNFYWANAPRDVKAAAEGARGHYNRHETVGPDLGHQYPHRFANHEGLVLAPDCAGNPLSEYPLTSNLPYRNNTNPDRFRVVVKLLPVGSADVRLCTVMFHRRDGTFVNCPWRRP